MNSEAEDCSEQESRSAPRLALFAPMRSKSAEQLNNSVMMSTPPHHSASVPFRWEEEPGKPRPCVAETALSLAPFKGLDLPPRLQLFESRSGMTKTPSPTTVLEGPYVGRSIFHSLRITRNREGSFEDQLSGGSSPDQMRATSLGLSRRWLLQSKHHQKGADHSWRRHWRKNKGQERVVVDEGSFVFSCRDTEAEEVVTRAARKKSSLGLAKHTSSFWATIYGAAKQVIPSLRRSRWNH